MAAGSPKIKGKHPTNTSNDTPNHQNTNIMLTTLRKSTAPYLPPPLLQTIHATDTYFHLHHPSITLEYMASEPSMALFSSIFLAYVVWRSMQGLHYLVTFGTSRSTAHLSEENELGVLGGLQGNKDGVTMGKGGGIGSGSRNSSQGDKTLSASLGYEPPFQETVVLCGASGSGKTALLHYLCSSNKSSEEEEEENKSWNPPMTVTSLVANVGYLAQNASIHNGNTADDATKNNAIRIIDYPGHISLSSQLPTLLNPSSTSRIVFALDATQPVAQGVSLLYQSILVNSQVRHSWKKEQKKLVILVVCTKNDEKGAKNYKRMKIQVRNELDRLRKVDLALIADGANGDGGDNNIVTLDVKGKTIDLDNLGEKVPVALHFVETGFGDRAGLRMVRDFVATGALPKMK